MSSFLVGGVEEGTHGARQRGQKSLCAGAIEVRRRGSGRLRLRVVPDASVRSLGGFVDCSDSSEAEATGPTGELIPTCDRPAQSDIVALSA
jgi:hypothetical protein